MGLAVMGSLLPESPPLSMLVILFLTVTLLSLCTHCRRRSANRQRNTGKSNSALQIMPDENMERRENPSINSLTMDEIVIQPTKNSVISTAIEGFPPWRSHSLTLDLQDETQNSNPDVKNPNSGDKSTDVTTGGILMQSIPVDQTAKIQQAPVLVVTPCRETESALQSGSAVLVPIQLDCPNGISQPSHARYPRDSKSQNQHIYEELAEDKKLPHVPSNSIELPKVEEQEDPMYNTIEELELPESRDTGQNSEHEKSTHVLTVPPLTETSAFALGGKPNILYARVSKKNKSMVPPPLPSPPPPTDIMEGEDDGEEAPAPPLPKRNLTLKDYQSIKDTGN